MFYVIVLLIFTAVLLIYTAAIAWYLQNVVRESPPQMPQIRERLVVSRKKTGEEIELPRELILRIASHVSPDGRHLLRQTNHAYRIVLPVAHGTNREIVRRLLGRLPKCLSCYANRGFLPRSPSEKVRRPLWCSGCVENHPAVYFTYQQRLSSRSTRTCISRQGHVRICSHASLSWSDVEKARWKTLRLNCQRRDHSGHTILLEIETAIVANGATSMKVTIYTSPWNIFQQISLTAGTSELPSPRMAMETITKSGKGEAAASLCPHASFNPAKWQMQLSPQHKREPCDISLNQDIVSKNFFSERANGTGSPFNHLCPLYEMTTRNDAPASRRQSSRATHHDSCSQCNAKYDWTWYRARLFGHSLDSLSLKTTRQFTFTKPTDPEWLRNLEIIPGGPTDPRGDPETKHLLWCDANPGIFVDWNHVTRWVHPWTWP